MAPEFPHPRTAIVTGAARRIGADIAEALLADGWHVLVHCNTSRAEAEARFASDLQARDSRARRDWRARIVEADLADPGAAAAIMAALDGLPPPALLVNNASRFVYDSVGGDSTGGFTCADWDAHFAVNLRAPALLSQAFAAAVPAGQSALIVNLSDAKLDAPNADFFTYTLSKGGLASLTELLARALAGRGIRVCAIAPSVTLVSGPQSRDNFDAVHRLNALGRGVTSEQIVAALRFIVATPTMTGQTITLDGGQRFLGLARDVQFVEPR